MISLKLTETKKLMSQLLLSELFDHFLFMVILSPLTASILMVIFKKIFMQNFHPKNFFLLLPLSPVLRHFQNILTGNKYANIVFL